MDKDEAAKKYVENTIFVDETDFDDEALIYNMRMMAFCAGWRAALEHEDLAYSDVGNEQ